MVNDAHLSITRHMSTGKFFFVYIFFFFIFVYFLYPIQIWYWGDGRNDSPGSSAWYLTFILMEHDSKDVLDIQVVEKRETGGKTPAMDLEGLKRSLQKVEEAGVIIEELVTDAHPSITRHMSKFCFVYFCDEFRYWFMHNRF